MKVAHLETARETLRPQSRAEVILAGEGAGGTWGGGEPRYCGGRLLSQSEVRSVRREAERKEDSENRFGAVLWGGKVKRGKRKKEEM